MPQGAAVRVARLLVVAVGCMIFLWSVPQMTGAAPLANKHCTVRTSTAKTCRAAGPTRTPAPTPTFGNHPPTESLAVVIVQLPGFTETPTSDDLQPFLGGAGYPPRGVPSLKDFYQKEAGVTYNRITIEAPITMPDDMFAQIPACDQMQLLESDYALALAYYPAMFARYDQIMFFNSEQPDCLWNAGSPPDYGDLRNAVSVFNYNSEDPYLTARAILHESGHAAFRLNHSKTRVDGVVHEYGSQRTIMGFNRASGLNIVDRRVIGSTTGRNVRTITASGDYTICPRLLLRPACIQDLRVRMTDNEGYYPEGTRAWMNIELDTESDPTPAVCVIVWDDVVNGVADPDWDVADLTSVNGTFSDPNATVTVKSVTTQGAVVHIDLPG